MMIVSKFFYNPTILLDNIMVNDYNEFSENLDPNIQWNYCATTTNKLMTAANSIKEIMEQRNQMALELIK